MNITNTPLPYQSLLDPRETNTIGLVVVHCTELPDLATARKYGEKVLYDSGTGNSGHFYIDRDGSIHQWVAIDRIAHHVKNHNQQSIGIELVNKGRFPDWYHSENQDPQEDYPDVQIDSLVSLIHHLHRSTPSLKHIAGHEDMDNSLTPASNDPTQQVRRKIDPGPLFPWHHVMKNIQLINIGSTAKKYE